MTVSIADLAIAALCGWPFLWWHGYRFGHRAGTEETVDRIQRMRREALRRKSSEELLP